MIKIESKKVIRSAKKLSVFILYFLVYIRYIKESRLLSKQKGKLIPFSSINL